MLIHINLENDRETVTTAVSLSVCVCVCPRARVCLFWYYTVVQKTGPLCYFQITPTHMLQY